MSDKRERTPRPTFDPEYIRDISEKVYRLNLERDCDGNVARMIEKDEDGGKKLRNRAGAYDSVTRLYLKVLGFEPPALTDEKRQPSYCALCDMEHQLHEDAKGFHHVIKGERVACASAYREEK